MKLTFKKHPRETGLRGVGYSHSSVDIKLNKKKIGLIQAPNWQAPDRKWGLAFTIENDRPEENPNCKWRWAFLKQRFDTEEAAREYLNANIEMLANRFKFFPLED